MSTPPVINSKRKEPSSTDNNVASSTLPQSSKICTNWPNCSFDAGCKFVHPSLQTLLPGRQNNTICPPSYIEYIYIWLFNNAQLFQLNAQVQLPFPLNGEPYFDFPTSSDNDTNNNDNDDDTETSTLQQQQQQQQAQVLFHTQCVGVPLMNFFRQVLRVTKQESKTSIDQLLAFLSLPGFVDLIKCIKSLSTTEPTKKTSSIELKAQYSGDIIPIPQCSINKIECMTTVGPSPYYVISQAIKPLENVPYGAKLLVNNTATEYTLLLGINMIELQNQHAIAKANEKKYVELHNASSSSTTASSSTTTKTTPTPTEKKPYQRIPKPPNPNFKVYPVNFVYGATRLVPTDDGVLTEIHTSPMLPPNEQQNEIPEKYRNMIPYRPHRSELVFYTTKEQVLKALQISYSMSSEQKQKRIHEAELVELFRPTTTNKPRGWFPPYLLSTLTTSPQETNAKWLQNLALVPGMTSSSSIFNNPVVNDDPNELILRTSYHSCQWLENWGWKHGMSLTDCNQGIRAPIDVLIRPDRLGLGAEDLED